MPQIPIVSAGPAGAQSDIFPSRQFHVPETSDNVGAASAQMSKQLADISGKIRAQSEEVELADMIGYLHGGLKLARLNLNRPQTRLTTGSDEEGAGLSYNDEIVTDPEERQRLFLEQANILRDNLSKTSKSPKVQAAFSAYYNKHLPGESVDVLAEGVKLQGKTVVASMMQLRDDIAERAATASTPAARTGIMGVYLEQVNRAEQRGIIDPVEAAKERKDFKIYAQKSYMSHLGRTDPDRMLKEFEAGEFDEVPVLERDSIYNRTIIAQATAARNAEHWRVTNNKIWTASVEREFQKLLDARKPTTELREYLNEFGGNLDDNKLKAFDKTVSDRERGIGTGNPQVEQEFQILVGNRVSMTNKQLQQTIDQLNTARINGSVGTEHYTTYINELNAEMVRREAKAETGENKIKQLQNNDYHATLATAEQAFRNSGGMLEKLDQANNEVLTWIREQLIENTSFAGRGNEPAYDVYKRLLPQGVARVKDKLDPHLKFLQTQIGGYRTKGELKAAFATGRIKQPEFDAKMKSMEELYSTLLWMNRLSNEAKQRGEK